MSTTSQTQTQALTSGNTKNTDIGTNPFYYPKSAQKFDAKLFENPTAEYRGQPFWAWNNALTEEQLLHQVHLFKKMGMGGFHMHVRCGLDTEYLGEEFLSLVRKCCDAAEEDGLLACLYDEDRWPSGSAGGLISKQVDNNDFKAHHMQFTKKKLVKGKDNFDYLIARYKIKLDEDGRLEESKVITDDNEPDADDTWYAYYVADEPRPAYNGGTYGNQLNPAAVEAFIKLTHEKYYDTLKDKFGKSVPSMFTDEPRSYTNNRLYDASVEAYTTDYNCAWPKESIEEFEAKYHYSLLETLPELALDRKLGSGPSKTRHDFYDYHMEKFVSTYVDRLSEWCRDHNILLLGHADGEGHLYDQTKKSGGEAMRTYRNMGMPGIDMLVDRLEFGTAKQAQSISRQRGLKGVMSELYGVMGYHATFEDYKGHGDWQAALGVTLRVPHLTWISMVGEAKRDYPPSIGYQSPWYEKFSILEDHFSRLSSVLTRGNPICRVAVIHPIESYWLSRGPRNTNYYTESLLEKSFEEICQWLVYGHLDFDFIAESMLPGYGGDTKDGKLIVGACAYEAVLLPNLQTIRSSTVERLQKFAAAGGSVYILGEAPNYLDAEVPKRALNFPSFKQVNWARERVLETLEVHRDLKITITEPSLGVEAGDLAESLVYQYRDDGDKRFLFICNMNRLASRPSKLTLNGSWIVKYMDTFTGEIASSPFKNTQYHDGKTVFEYYFNPTESALFLLEPGSVNASNFSPERPIFKDYKELTEYPVQLKKVDFSEPNVLLLDYATYTIGGDSKIYQEEEVLKIDNAVRLKFGIPYKSKTNRQPWTLPAEERKPLGEIELQFSFQSDIEVSGCSVALEKRGGIKGLKFDDDDVALDFEGGNWWVDEELIKMNIPTIKPGKHVIKVQYDFGHLTNIERIYILGEFGVELRGRQSRLVPLNIDRFVFADITRQNMPFYVGNTTYTCEVTVDEPIKDAAVFFPEFKAPLLTVDTKGHSVDLIAKPPLVKLGDLEKGRHEFKVTAYGERNNSFGPIHLAKNSTEYMGPLSYRTEHDWWAEEYDLHSMGLIQRPRLMSRGKEVYYQNRRGLEMIAPVM